MTFKIDSNDAGIRLDNYMSEKMNLSRSKVSKMISDEKVLVNNKPTKNNRTKCKTNKKNNLICLKINKLKTKKNQSIPKPKISQLETKSTASFNKFLLGSSGNSILLKQV